MNAPIKLSLAIALALGGSNVWALGLGAIQVKSGLNQPLVAEIPVTVSSPGEAADLSVALASDEDFQRIGLSRARVGATLQFAVITPPHGSTVIQITSTESVREPYLDFLLQANWAKGKLLREYTVLLDPPVTAPAASKPAPVVESRPQPVAPVAKPAPPVVARSEPAPSQPRSAPAPVAAAPAGKPAAAPSSAAINGKEYGPVTSGSALSQVAQAVRGDSSTDLNQLMLALYKANPQAFFRPNINALKTGAVLRIPSADEIQAVGSLREAAAQVASQTRDWSAGAAPTMVAGGQSDLTGKSDKSTKNEASEKKPSSEHLALVPPRAGKDEQSKSDQPGSAGRGKTGTGYASAAELARTQESLVAREHEAAELKSRVKDLEDLKSKNDRLISLKDSEIAELQRKLKEAQDAAAKTAPKPAPATVAESKLGDKAAADKLAADKLASDKAAADKASADKAAAAAAALAATASNPATAPGATKSDSASPATITAAPPPSTPSTATTPAPTSAPVAVTPPATPASSSDTGTPSASTATTAPPAATTPAAPKPATPAPAKPTPAPAVATVPAEEEPWYKSIPVLAGAGVVLVVLGVITLLRSRKPAAPVRPVRDTATIDAEPPHEARDEEEHALLEELARHPDDIDRHLELLSLYYAQRDVAKFESAAQAMHAQISDPSQLEWQQVKAMGAELAPTHPLFADAEVSAHYPATPIDRLLDDEHHEPGPIDPAPLAWDADDRHEAVTQRNQRTLHADELDLPFTPSPAPLPPTQVESTHAAEDVIDTVPYTPEPLGLDEAIVTKLDLARAYLDMGDPDGARSMVEEVLAEGNETQKIEARKLLEEIR